MKRLYKRKEQPATDRRVPIAKRFRGCPPICDIANLPSFSDQASANVWHDVHGERTHMRALWRCACGAWHYWSVGPAPAGATSDTERGSSDPLPLHVQTLVQQAKERGN